MFERVISGIFFMDENFAGFRTMDAQSKKQQYDFDMDMLDPQITIIDQKIADNYDTTRLVGFRTGKRCRGDMNILQIQAIYYSVSEEMCLSRLMPIVEHMRTELPYYGSECNMSLIPEDDLVVQEIEREAVKEAVEQALAAAEAKPPQVVVKKEEGTTATEAAAWITMFLLLATGVLRCHAHARQRRATKLR